MSLANIWINPALWARVRYLNNSHCCRKFRQLNYNLSCKASIRTNFQPDNHFLSFYLKLLFMHQIIQNHYSTSPVKQVIPIFVFYVHQFTLHVDLPGFPLGMKNTLIISLLALLQPKMPDIASTFMKNCNAYCYVFILLYFLIYFFIYFCNGNARVSEKANIVVISFV